jgi:hypothetical protein
LAHRYYNSKNPEEALTGLLHLLELAFGTLARFALFRQQVLEHANATKNKAMLAIVSELQQSITENIGPDRAKAIGMIGEMMSMRDVKMEDGNAEPETRVKTRPEVSNSQR